VSATPWTPGPWARSGVRAKLGVEDCLRVGPDGFPVVFVPIGRTHKDHAGAMADAALIAEAPVMAEALEALHEAADMLLSGAGRVRGDENYDDLFTHELRHAQHLSEVTEKVAAILARIRGATR
jgi:hypothetical protein